MTPEQMLKEVLEQRVQKMRLFVVEAESLLETGRLYDCAVRLERLAREIQFYPLQVDIFQMLDRK